MSYTAKIPTFGKIQLTATYFSSKNTEQTMRSGKNNQANVDIFFITTFSLTNRTQNAFLFGIHKPGHPYYVSRAIPKHATRHLL
jgi:hypothetical protein